MDEKQKRKFKTFQRKVRKRYPKQRFKETQMGYFIYQVESVQ